MKHITLTLIAATAALGASAQSALPENPVYVPQTVTLKNPSFESLTRDWEVVTPEGCLGFSGNKAGQHDGTYSVRVVEGQNSLGKGTLIYQNVSGANLGAGTYLLVGYVITGRNAFRSPLNDAKNPGACYFSLFIADQSHDPINDATSEGYSVIYETAVNPANYGPATFVEQHVVLESSEAAPQLKVGCGVLTHSAPIGKGGMYADDFRLLYFPNRTKADVENWLQTGDVLPDASNDDETSGITDITLGTAGKYYNLMGVEIDKPTSAGIYIYNGKKYVVK